MLLYVDETHMLQTTVAKATNTRQLHTMNMSTIHALIDLCAYPEHVDDLRNEITLHLPSSAPPWSFDTINRLKALDAFLKESQRFNTPNYRKSG